MLEEELPVGRRAARMAYRCGSSSRAHKPARRSGAWMRCGLELHKNPTQLSYKPGCKKGRKQQLHLFLSDLASENIPPRSLNMDFENQDKEKDSSNSAGPFNGGSTNNSIQTIDSTQALFLPIGASVSLLVMFFFFDSVQVVFTICTAVLATIAFAFLLLPMCQYLTRPCSPQNKISFGCCGRFTAAELLSFSLSVMLVLIWVLTGHWLLMDALAMGLCVAMIAFVRLPSLKVSCLLLSGLLIYDVFWSLEAQGVGRSCLPSLQAEATSVMNAQRGAGQTFNRDLLLRGETPGTVSTLQSCLAVKTCLLGSWAIHSSEFLQG
ncbi:hypothetical protein E2320_012768 [Naja naja]|nr:hypothetical protein E2320_012768 [Naja naja]